MSSHVVRLIVLSGLFYLIHATGYTQDHQDQRIITIATGGTTGAYYPVGSAICQLVNEQTARHGLRCAVASSEGSIANLRSLSQGDADLAMVQSDWQFHAYRGTSAFSDEGDNPDLRFLLSLHSEPLTIVSRTDAHISSIADLRGKRVNIGNPGSGQRATMQVLLVALGWTLADFAVTLELPVGQQAGAMCDDEVDAIVFVGGHPNRSVLEATTLCDAVIVAATGPAVDKLTLFQPYYSYALIPGGMYRNNPADIPTFGVTATLLTSTDLPEQIGYTVVQSVFEHLTTFKTMHPSLATLQPAQMVQVGRTAPLHSGALRYYREAGLLPGDSSAGSVAEPVIGQPD